MSDPVRAQVEFAPGESEKINELRKRLGLEKVVELLNNALTILVWAVEEREKGREIASVDEVNKQYEMLRIPILDRIMPKTT